MASIVDDRGYNQVFVKTKSTEVRLHRRAELIMSKMSNPANKRVMEIGSGTGEVAYWIAEKLPVQVLATDLCVPFIEQSKEKYVLPNLRYEVLDFNKAEQFKNENFDYIIGNGILHHLYHHLDSALKNILNRNLNENYAINVFLPISFFSRSRARRV